MSAATNAKAAESAMLAIAEIRAPNFKPANEAFGSGAYSTDALWDHANPRSEVDRRPVATGGH
jgi:hypothetical protein